MKTTISKYKNKGSINLGDGLYLDLFIGMTQEGGGGDTSNIKTITSGYSEGYELQQVFSIPQGHSVIMAVRVSTMATTYTDLLRYSCSGDTSVQNFYCDNIIYFTENKALPTIGYPVCIKAKNSPYAPASKYTFKVLYASCGVDKITWYDNVFVNRKAYARENERLTLKNDPIDEDAETTQVLATDAQGALDGIDLQNYTDFIIDTSASSGSCTFSPASFKPDNIYRIMFSEDGEVNFTDIPNCQDATAQVKGDSIVSIVFQEGTNGEYYLAIDQQPIEVYYTKEETDNLIDEKISEIDLSDVVHKSGAEAITGNKDFRNSTPRFTAMYIGLGSRLLTYSNVGFDFEGYIQASSGRIEPEGMYSVMLVSGRAVYNALQAYLKKADIATTLDGATDDKVPSAKCVADALEEISFDDTNLVHKSGAETIAGAKTFSDGVVLNSSGTIASGSARAVNGGTVYEALSSKADDGTVIKAIILNGVTYVPASGVVDLGSVGSSSVPVIIKSQATTLLPGMLGRDNEGDGRVEIYGGANGIYGWHSVITKTYALFNVNSTPPTNASNGYIMFNTTTHKTLVRYDNKWWDAMGNEVTEEIAYANEIGAVDQGFTQGGVQDITLAQTSHYKTTYVRVTCAAQINIQIIAPNAEAGDILIVDTARCEAGGVCFRPVKYSSNAGYHAFDVCENTAVTYGSTNFQTLIKWYYNGTSWQRLEKTICGPLANVSDL